MNFQSLIQEYEQDHQNTVNKRIHLFAVPVIVFAVFGMLNQLHVLDQTSLGFLLWFVASVFYFVFLPEGFLSKAVFSFVLLIIYAMSRMLPLSAHVVLFLVGWVFQFIGHGKYEKKSPAFFRNLVQLMVGPYWVWVKLTQKRD